MDIERELVLVAGDSFDVNDRRIGAGRDDSVSPVAGTVPIATEGLDPPIATEGLDPGAGRGVGGREIGDSCQAG